MLGFLDLIAAASACQTDAARNENLRAARRVAGPDDLRRLDNALEQGDLTALLPQNEPKNA